LGDWGTKNLSESQPVEKTLVRSGESAVEKGKRTDKEVHLENLARVRNRTEKY